MKKTLTKTLYTGLIISLAFSFWLVEVPRLVDAQTCDPNETPGTLLGYALTENLGPIYLSTESWNQANASEPTNVSFFVDYDKQNGLWSGRGWNETVGWVDFSYDTIGKKARFEEPGKSHDNGNDDWGNWPGVIDLGITQQIQSGDGNILITPVKYSPNTGGFNGLGLDSSLTGGGDNPVDDDYVGAGIVDFSNVQFVKSDCQEYVDLFLDDVSILHNDVCPLPAPLIKWNSQGVSNCQTVDGLWSNPGGRANKNLLDNESASASITDVNSPVLFRLKCIGQQSGADVFGVAVASCGEKAVDDPDSGFNFKIWEN
jgi:hypothetical protein